MDKITIVLQDKKTIEELAKDPEVQIKVKDAIIDAIGKRALKISSLQDEIIKKRRKELWDFFFDKGWYGRDLKEEFRTEIRNQAKAPEKIYLSDFTDTTEAVFYVKQDKTKKTDTEYIRTDAFIKKAKKWFNSTNGIVVTDTKAFFEEFIDYMGIE